MNADELERSEIYPVGTDPWEDGVYEVDFIAQFRRPGEPSTPQGYARYWTHPPQDSNGNHWSRVVLSASQIDMLTRPAGDGQPAWRGVSRAEALRLGLVRDPELSAVA